LSTKQAVWGDTTQNYAISCGHKKENVIITGSPRHDKFFNYSSKPNKKGIILFATTGWAGVATETSTVRSMMQFENFVKTVFDVMKKFPEKQLIIKPHPHSENLVNALAIFKKLDPKIQVLPNANLTELIDSSEIVITFTNSTIALESIILGKPTMSLQIENWAKDEEIAKMNAVFSIYEEDEIEEGIKKLLYDEDFKKELQANAKNFLNQYMKFQGESSRKLAEELNNF
jgi:UDP-N-acetylglucosamine 2-epimerase